MVVEVEVDDSGKLFQGLDVHLLLQEAPLVDQEGQLPGQLVAEIKMALGSFRQVISWNVQLHFTFKPKKASKFFSTFTNDDHLSIKETRVAGSMHSLQ